LCERDIFFLLAYRLTCRNGEQYFSELLVGIGGRRAVDFDLFGLKALDIHRLIQISDKVDVSIDWLLDRSNSMDMPEFPDPPTRGGGGGCSTGGSFLMSGEPAAVESETAPPEK
jgi:hypothetical protein